MRKIAVEAIDQSMPVTELAELVVEAPAIFDCDSRVSDRGSLRACMCEAPFPRMRM